MDGRWIRWTSPAGDAGVQFDAFATQQPNPTLATWTVWAGPNLDRATWTLTASPYTPSSLLADLSENLAHATGTRQAQAAGRERRTSLGTTPPAIPAVNADAAVSRTRQA
ncbi:SPDY domain-containing protein [Streptomyces incanus]